MNIEHTLNYDYYMGFGVAPDLAHRFFGQFFYLSWENEPQFLTTKFVDIERLLHDAM